MDELELFPIVEIKVKQEIEQLGTKEKYWIYCQEEKCKKLFKIGRPNTGEDWAEVAAYEIAKLIDLPAAKYEFAKYKNSLGTVSTSIVLDNEQLIHGNEFLAEIDNNYPVNKFYKVKEYRLDTAAKIVSDIDEQYPNLSSLVNFIGYIVFDCLIANQDRHHENWGFILKQQGKLSLAPSYDHAAGFGCREQDAKIAERLVTKDKNFTVAAYCQRAKTPFYDKRSQRLGTLEACKLLGSNYPDQLCYWLEKIATIGTDDIRNIFARIPNEFISEKQRLFAQAILKENMTKLAALKKEICQNE